MTFGLHFSGPQFFHLSMKSVLVQSQQELDGHSNGVIEGSLMKGTAWVQLRVSTKDGEIQRYSLPYYHDLERLWDSVTAESRKGACGEGHPVN